MLPLKGETGAVWPWRGCNKHHDVRALPYRGGSGDRNSLRNGGQRPPPDRRSRLSAPSPDPGYRIREVETRHGEAEGDGAAEDRCKGTEQAWRINCKIVSRRSPPPRHLRGVCEEREGGFHLAVSHFT